MSLAAPWLGTIDPTLLDPVNRDLLPGARARRRLLDGEKLEHTFWMGTDSYGRDIYSRVLYGGRVSLIVGVAVAVLSCSSASSSACAPGYLRWLDAVVMRVMDGLMAIPGDAARDRAGGDMARHAVDGDRRDHGARNPARGAPGALAGAVDPRGAVRRSGDLGRHADAEALVRHILPNTIAPLIVQGTYICASAMLLEAILSFLGVGLPTEVPTWGNIMAEGRLQFIQYPHNVFFPGVFLAFTVLAVNMLGDGLRDTLDPQLRRRRARHERLRSCEVARSRRVAPAARRRTGRGGVAACRLRGRRRARSCAWSANPAPASRSSRRRVMGLLPKTLPVNRGDASS